MHWHWSSTTGLMAIRSGCANPPILIWIACRQRHAHHLAQSLATRKRARFVRYDTVSVLRNPSNYVLLAGPTGRPHPRLQCVHRPWQRLLACWRDHQQASAACHCSIRSMIYQQYICSHCNLQICSDVLCATFGGCVRGH